MTTPESEAYQKARAKVADADRRVGLTQQDVVLAIIHADEAEAGNNEEEKNTAERNLNAKRAADIAARKARNEAQAEANKAADAYETSQRNLIA